MLLCTPTVSPAAGAQSRFMTESKSDALMLERFRSQAAVVIFI